MMFLKSIALLLAAAINFSCTANYADIVNPKPTVSPITVMAKTKPECETVKNANKADYSFSISESGRRLSVAEIKTLCKPYGSFGNTEGMPTEEYLSAMKYQWKDVTVSKKAKPVAVSLTAAYEYSNLVSIMKCLSRFDGVYMYSIGESEQGKPLYALEVNRTGEKNPKTVLLTGQVHGREFAGSTFILKELADIIQSDSKEAKGVLSKVRFVAVPCVNPDAHDGIINDTEKWTYSDGQYWKANTDGVDINRNFPGLSWLQVKRGNKQTSAISKDGTGIYYWGDYAGCAKETQAMMKFYQYFIGICHAEILVDYHQQGRITYAGKGYASDSINKLAEELRKACTKTQKSGRLGKAYSACYDDNSDDFGLCGTGSTNTDYAYAVALGAKFSTALGFSVYTDKKGNEYPLIMVPHRDNTKYDLEDVTVPTFRSLSWEIGSGSKYLGFGETARKLIAQEYDDYNFGRMLYTYAEEILK